MQKLAVIITTSPYDPLTITAIDVIENALKTGITIVGVFFYRDGVINANQHIDIPSDEFQSFKHWQLLVKQYDLPLHLCITAAEKRGLSDENQMNINPIFTVSGLGELVEITSIADRVLQL